MRWRWGLNGDGLEFGMAGGWEMRVGGGGRGGGRVGGRGGGGGGGGGVVTWTHLTSKPPTGKWTSASAHGHPPIAPTGRLGPTCTLTLRGWWRTRVEAGLTVTVVCGALIAIFGGGAIGEIGDCVACSVGQNVRLVIGKL